MLQSGSTQHKSTVSCIDVQFDILSETEIFKKFQKADRFLSDRLFCRVLGCKLKGAVGRLRCRGIVLVVLNTLAMFQLTSW